MEAEQGNGQGDRFIGANSVLIAVLIGAAYVTIVGAFRHGPWILLIPAVMLPLGVLAAWLDRMFPANTWGERLVLLVSSILVLSAMVFATMRTWNEIWPMPAFWAVTGSGMTWLLLIRLARRSKERAAIVSTDSSKT